MCLVAYIASHLPLPVVPWNEHAPAFNVAEVSEHDQAVLVHFKLPNVRYAGSHTGCGCGFNDGREYPQAYDDASTASTDALKSTSQLARYVREYHVEQIYSCWSGDEGEPPALERGITPEELVSPAFFFREEELLTIHYHTL